MTKSFFFILEDEEIAITMHIQDLLRFPHDIQTQLFVDGKYNVRSAVDSNNLLHFVEYIIDENNAIEVTVENACEIKMLLDEFNIEKPDFITDDIIKMSYLIRFNNNSIKEKSDLEKYFAKNLDFYLANNQNDMLNIPFNSLRNIFFHKERVLINEELAYQFIINANNISFYALLGSLNYEKLSQKSKDESFQKIEERFGFLPKINYIVLEEREKLFYKLYVANIKNRLNEITNPTDEDKIRWPMELIQNAKDSLYISIKEQKSVKITFIIDHDPNNLERYSNVVFIHNGPPFTINSYYGLIYKISEGKNKEKTTGKFGTGFLTSHVLSKTVHISGDRIEKNNEIAGFSITMIREGKENDEIIDDIQKMQDTFIKYDRPFKYTKFEYPIKTELSSKCVKLGIIYFYKHICNVLINCPDIECISLIEDGNETVFSVEKIDSINDSIYRYKVSARKKESPIVKEFVVVNDNINKISISVELSGNMIVPKKKDQESLYTVFPLVGSSAHALPFSINCPNFEPTVERNALILDGEESINGEETKVFTNRKILLNSIKLFSKLVIYLNEIHCANMYELTVGLKITEKPYSSFDFGWYYENFIKELRNEISRKVKVRTISNNYILLSDAFIPDQDIDDKLIKDFINLSAMKIYYPNMICIEDCIIWRKCLWDTLHYVKVVDIIYKVKYDNLLLVEDRLLSLQNFISFIINYRKDLLEQVKQIIPNVNGNLHYLNELFNISNDFHDHLNTIIKSYFRYDYNEKIIHPIINKIIKSDKDEKITDMLDIINNNLLNLREQDQIVIAESVLAIVPQNSNLISSTIDQNDLYNYYKMLFKPNLNKIIIKDELFSIKHWKLSNTIIINVIIKVIEQCKTLNNFTNNFLINEEVAFDILNFLYKQDFLFQYQDHKIVPNRDGEFKFKRDLTTNPGIDNEFFNLLSTLDARTQIHKGIVHYKVKIEKLNLFNVHKFFQTLSDTMDQILNDPNADHEKVESIKKFLNFDVNKFSNHSTKGLNDKMDLLINTHISFIHNRIREIVSPSIYDYQRWPFELIQNATDCIQKEEEQISDKNGTMMFEFNENQVIFTHYGAPFTNENLISLLYQYGGGKEGTKSIGRFGTGFLTTLVLSRVAHVSGDLVNYENGIKTISGFEATIDRNGENRDQLKNGVISMEETKRMDLPVKGETKFIFDIKPSSNTEAYDEGYNSLKNNIPQTLVFNPTIKSIILKNKNETLTFQNSHINNSSIKEVTIRSSKEPLIIKKTFIYVEKNYKFDYTFKLRSQILSKSITINCIVEIGSENNIICNDEFLYLAFPMFGTKPFSSPIIINSLDFEPQKERNDIIVQLDEKRVDSYETAINKFIIQKSVELFKEIIKISIDRRCTNLFNFCKGINKDSENSFFQNNFVHVMRDVFTSFKIFKTSNGYKKYDEIFIPKIENYDDFLGNIEENEKEEKKDSIYTEFYYLISSLKMDRDFVELEQSLKWIPLLWPKFKSTITIDGMLEFISKQRNIWLLPYNRKDTRIAFLNKVIEFLAKSKKNKYYINRYAFLINQNGDFTPEKYLYNLNLDDELINLLEDVGYDYKKDIINSEIKKNLNNDYEFKEFDTKLAIEKIKSIINDNNYLCLMKYVTDPKREKIWKLAKEYLNKQLEKKSFNISPPHEKDFDEMFKRADNIVYDKLINYFQKVDIKKNISNILELVEILSDNLANTQLRTKKIFPNQLYELHTLNELCSDWIDDENVLNIIKDVLKIDYKKQLIYKSFSKFADNNIGFSKLSKNVDEYLQKNENKINDEDCIKICVMVLSDSKTQYEKIPELINFFYGQSINSKKYKNSFSIALIDRINHISIKRINNLISNKTNINEFPMPQEKIFEQLHNLYKYSQMFQCTKKIFPNNSGKLMTIDEIQIIYDNQVDNSILYELYEYLGLFEPTTKDKDSFLHQSIKLTNEIIEKFNNKIVNLNSIAKKILPYKSEILNYKEDMNKKSEIEKFINFIRREPKLRVAFSEILQEIDQALRPDIYDYYNNQNSIAELFKLLEQQIELETIMNKNLLKPIPNNSSKKLYFIKFALFDEIKKSNLIENVESISFRKSEYKTDYEYNNISYIIDNKDYDCDFSGKDSKGNAFYFVVKLENDIQFNQKESSLLIKLMSSDTEYFVTIVVNNSYKIGFQWRGHM